MSSLETTLSKSLTANHWQRIGVRPHHGILVVLSALHSSKSCGIGEFLDIIPLLDWCNSIRFDFLQFLPLNHAQNDPSPYNSESSCAFNDIYLSLWALPDLNQNPQLLDMLEQLQTLSKTDRVLYERVAQEKQVFLKIYYEQIGSKQLDKEEFKQFLQAQPWVKPYALFKVLKNQFNQTPWRTWPSAFKFLSPSQREHLYSQYEEEMHFYLFTQYLCFVQMQEVKCQAKKRCIFLMGDLPILLSSESADNWLYPDFFDSHLGAGAPADQYNSEGQNWELPIFNWDAVKKDHFSWWKQRLSYAELFFDLFRLDHILGFFRIFAIPFKQKTTEGFYIPSNDTEAEKQGIELLSKLISLTHMLPIGEDLGTVPDYVRPHLKSLGICGTKVMRWERYWKTDQGFIPIEQYEPLSLSCVSTHDSEPLSLWWKNYEEEACLLAQAKRWTYTKELSTQQRTAILKDCHSSRSLFHANLLQEYLALFPELTHLSPEEERINVPGTLLKTNWTYRYKPSVEQIINQIDLQNRMRVLLDPQE